MCRRIEAALEQVACVPRRETVHESGRFIFCAVAMHAELMDASEVNFIGKMILDEVMELFATVMPPAETKVRVGIHVHPCGRGRRRRRPWLQTEVGAG